MSKVGSWSTTAGSNNATPPDGWPEGQAPSTVNDCAREMMAAIRTYLNDAQFLDINLTPTQTTSTTFTVTGNQTSAIHAGRRLKLFDYSTLYATVISSTFTANTSVTAHFDISASATSSLSSFALAIASHTTPSMPSSVPKAWCRILAQVGPRIDAQYNIASVSRSALGVYRINFTNSFYSGDYAFVVSLSARTFYQSESAGTGTSFKLSLVDVSGSAVEGVYINAAFYR